MAGEAADDGRTQRTQIHTDKHYRDVARELYVEAGYIEIDESATISAPEEGGDGVYVQAWVYVANTDVSDNGGPEGDPADDADLMPAVAA